PHDPRFRVQARRHRGRRAAERAARAAAEGRARRDLHRLRRRRSRIQDGRHLQVLDRDVFVRLLLRRRHEPGLLRQAARRAEEARRAVGGRGGEGGRRRLGRARRRREKAPGGGRRAADQAFGCGERALSQGRRGSHRGQAEGAGSEKPAGPAGVQADPVALGKALQELAQLLELIARIFGYVAAAFLAAMMLLTVADVLLRAFFGYPVRGMLELIELGLACTVFFGMPAVFLRKEHLVVDAIDQLTRPAVVRLLDLAGALVSFGLLAFMAWQMVPVAKGMYDFGD